MGQNLEEKIRPLIKTWVFYGNKTYRGDHFEMYRNNKSVSCSPGTNTVLQVSYTSKINKHRKRDKICGYQRQGVGGGGIG